MQMRNPVFKAVKNYGVYCLVTGAVLFIGAGVQNGSDDLFDHSVRAGESISLICIDYYGYYSTGLGNAVQALNPSIKNLNLIFPGQKIRLRKPKADSIVSSVAEAEAETVVPQRDTVSEKEPVEKKPASVKGKPDDSLFVRKVAVTQGVVTCVEGTVVYREKKTGSEKPLKVNTVLSPGAILTTKKDGRVELIINREAVVRMRKNTRMVLEEFRQPKQNTDKTTVECSIGSLWTKVKKFKDRISRFELELPKAIAGVHGTVYESTVTADDASEVRVFDGEVAVRSAEAAAGSARENSGSALHEVSGPHEVQGPHEVTMEEWTRIVRSMQKVTISSAGMASEPVTFKKTSASSWEEWNVQRDLRIAEMFGEL